MPDAHEVQAPRNKPGPKKTGQGTQLQVRVHDDLLMPLDRWISSQPEPRPSRAEAIRRLIRSALELGRR